MLHIMSQETLMAYYKNGKNLVSVDGHILKIYYKKQIIMTREEQIREAINKTFPCANGGGRCYEQAFCASGFELGVK